MKSELKNISSFNKTLIVLIYAGFGYFLFVINEKYKLYGDYWVPHLIRAFYLFAAILRGDKLLYIALWIEILYTLKKGNYLGTDFAISCSWQRQMTSGY